jgi:hypothetical protein
LKIAGHHLRLSKAAGLTYGYPMDRPTAEVDGYESLYLPLSIAAGLVALGIVGAAFYGWLNYGSSIFLSLAETGLSWCI